jgi:hypothetical protein
MDLNLKFETLKGKTLISLTGAENGSDSVLYTTTDGTVYESYHSQDCCESVSVVQVDGDVEDILNSEILMAEEATSSGFDDDDPRNGESNTWTFYKLATVKGYLTIRWLGTSNGYYSESVDFREVT